MKSTSAAPERIGLYGLEGSGKTKAIAETAKAYRDSNTPGTFHWITVESGSLNRFSDGYPGFWDNTVAYQYRDWMTLRSATDKALENATAGDWIVTENADRAWQLVRDLYDQNRARKLGIDLNDAFALLPEDEDRSRWDRINPEYYRWFDPLWDDTNPAHLMMTAPQTSVVVAGPKSKWEDSPDVLALYRHHGFRPDAQKAFSPRMHTVLWLQRPKLGEWTMTTIKDRERPMLQDGPLYSFPTSYLAMVAGWDL